MTTSPGEFEERPKTTTISFGTLFRALDRGRLTNETHVVTNIGEGDYFFSAQVEEIVRGVWSMSMGGTSGPENFGENLGQLSLDQVISALRLNRQRLGSDIKKTEIEYLLEQSQRGKRTLILSR